MSAWLEPRRGRACRWHEEVNIEVGVIVVGLVALLLMERFNPGLLSIRRVLDLGA